MQSRLWKVGGLVLALCFAAPPVSSRTVSALGYEEAEGAITPRRWLDGLAWLNAKPVRAADLAGKTVVVEFWTFDCVNCQRTVPAMRTLETTYRGATDVAILGIHTPELERERDANNVKRAITRLGLRFPIAQDNAATAWRAFDNEYWPALYVLDGRGAIRYRHVGELHEGTPAWTELLRTVSVLRSEGVKSKHGGSS